MSPPCLNARAAESYELAQKLMKQDADEDDDEGGADDEEDD